MLYKDKLIEEPISKYKVMKFLEQKLDRAGLASVDIQRTPLVTRITLEVTNPARIIGKKGRLINELTDTIKQEFKIENPQISVVEVREPFLEPRMVGKKAAKYIEIGKKVRAVLHYMLREVIRAGALGAEIVASGKIGAKGARAKSLRVVAGYIPKAGEPARLIRVAHISANTRSGVIGILVRIVPPGTVFPDKQVKAVVLPKVIEAAADVEKPGSRLLRGFEVFMMAAIRKSEIEKMSPADRKSKIAELERAMLELRGEGRLDKVRPLKKAIAKLNTPPANNIKKK